METDVLQGHDESSGAAARPIDVSTYDAFYARGGWRYRRFREWWWHRTHLVRRFNLRPGMRVLEIACGTGFHTDLFCRMGLECCGIDLCETAIHTARKLYPSRTFHQADAGGVLPFDPNNFDAIVTRGCSVYHYDLQADAPLRVTENALHYLKPGGLFVLIIASDLSGRRDPVKIWQNRLSDYWTHFARFHRPATVEWHRGMVICGMRNSDPGRMGAS